MPALSIMACPHPNWGGRRSSRSDTPTANRDHEDQRLMRQLDRTQFASIATFRQLCLGLLAAFALLAALPAGRALAEAQVAQPGATTRQEIRYRLPEAG